MAEMKLTASETRAQVLLAKHGDIGVADMAKKLRMPVSNTSSVELRDICHPHVSTGIGSICSSLSAFTSLAYHR
jgi:hypothetical protein